MLILGDARSNLVTNHERKMEEIKNKFKHKKDYYVMMVPNWQGHTMDVLKTTYMIMNKIPPKMLNSALFYINNKTNEEKTIWALPGDWDIDVNFLDQDSQCESVVKYSQDMKHIIKKS